MWRRVEWKKNIAESRGVSDNLYNMVMATFCSLVAICTEAGMERVEDGVKQPPIFSLYYCTMTRGLAKEE